MDIQKLIESLFERIKILEQNNAFLIKRVVDLEAELASFKKKKNSNNSHTPPSQDPNRPKKNQSLREKTGNKPGGQLGHEGSTLLCSDIVDEIIEHKPGYCNGCGNDLKDITETLIESRQQIDIPPIKPICVEHRIYRKTCSCGHQMESKFPTNITAAVQYGPGVESLVGYLHARQYLPYHRMQEFFKDVMNLPVSVGGINNILKRLTKKALPYYQTIKERIENAVFVGTDETSVKVNGNKDWIWTWQNEDLTFLVHSDNRGFKTIEDTFGNGLPNAILQHDRFACHFKCDALKHNICMAHLLRDLKYIDELYDKQCTWAIEMRTLIMQALELKKELTITAYYGPCEKRQKIEIKLNELLSCAIDKEHTKAKALLKNLLKHRNSIFNFLWHPKVPPDNNGSERAIRNIKVKQKISGQFKSTEGASCFVILRSVIDTTIKAGQNVLAALVLIATLGTE